MLVTFFPKWVCFFTAFSTLDSTGFNILDTVNEEVHLIWLGCNRVVGRRKFCFMFIANIPTYNCGQALPKNLDR